MIYYKTDEEIEKIRLSNLVVSRTHEYVAGLIKPGVTGAYLDQKAEEFIRDNKGKPAFKNYGHPSNPFPSSLCISVNEVVVHGIPNDVEFKETDIVSIDCGVELDGYFGDSAFTYAMPEVDDETMKLLEVTNESLYRGIQEAIVGRRIGDVSWAIQDFTEKQHGYGVVRELVGHGVGRALHESPDVPNYGKRGRGVKLKTGMVIAIEPMINMGTKSVSMKSDGWTVVTKDNMPSAHFEHSVAIRKGEADILSNHKIIEEAIKKNENIKDFSINF